MSETKGKDLASPMSAEDARETHGGYYSHKGLTKREYFAAKAMQGMLLHDRGEGIALDAVAMADALIEALNKE